MAGNLRPIGVLLCILLLVFPSCRQESGIAEDFGEIPDTVSENFRQVTVSPAGRVEVECLRVETYESGDLTVFSEASMRERNADGELTLEGRADRIEATGEGNGSAEGSVFVHDVPGDSRLSAERLEWDDKKRLLTGVGTVSIETGGGLTMAGEGFEADMAGESYLFAEGAEGTFLIEDAAGNDVVGTDMAERAD